MKLEKYLADYIEHDIANKEDFLTYIKHGCFNFEEVIKEGLDAFESTEDVTITISKPKSEPTFECVFYDGENGGIYHLLDFNPNGLSKNDLIKFIEPQLLHQCHIDTFDIEQALKSVYLLNTNTLIRLEDIK